MKRFCSLLAGLLVAGLAMASRASGAPGGGYNYSGPVVLPTTGALFGVHLKLDDHNGLDRRTAETNFEALTGRTIAVDRWFYNWNEVFPTADDYWSRDQGHILYLSWDSVFTDGTCAFWADVAGGAYDSLIDARAADIKAFAAPMIFAWHHEPTTKPPHDGSCGTYDEYKAAWRHVHDRFATDQVTNVTWAYTLTALSYDQGNAPRYYPGDDVVDVIAADGYNWYGCYFHPGPWREPIDIFQSFHDFGVQHAKPMFVAEYGTGEGDNLGKAQWFSNFANQMRLWQDVKGVAYFNVGGPGCERYVDTTPTSLAAYQTMGAEPYFNPPVTTAGVSETDSQYSPATVGIAQGTGVTWTNNGTLNHTTVDSSGMGLFNSGSLAPGANYSFYFIGAGNYQFNDAGNPAVRGIVRVPILADPPSGGETTLFTITWAADHAQAQYAFDVQIRRPGSTAWVAWQTAVTLNSATFTPDGGLGKYQFRGRIKNTTLSKACKWSAPVAIIVS